VGCSQSLYSCGFQSTILELQKQQQFHEQFRAEPLFMRLELLELLELLKMNRVQFTQT